MAIISAWLFRSIMTSMFNAIVMIWTMMSRFFTWVARQWWLWTVGFYTFVAIMIRLNVEAMSFCLGKLGDMQDAVEAVNSAVTDGGEVVSITDQYGAEVMDFLEIGNSFLPVVEFFECAAMLWGLAFVCLLYRFAKSWIPMLSG